MARYRTRVAPGYEQVVVCDDPESGLSAVIAIHDTTFGPALGGCRMWPYDGLDAAVADALRLSAGMTWKAALADLPLGGGKAVIVGDPRRDKTPDLFRAFGRFVDHLGGRYVTAEDVGTGVRDMEIVRTETRHVAGLAAGSGDPSPVTAAGVLLGLKAAVRHRLGRGDLKGLEVAVQGVGHVGYHLCRLLSAEGCELTVTDLSPEALERVVIEFDAKAVAPGAIHDVPADIFAPCALGGTLNADTIPRLKVAVVAGAANNQLADAACGEALHRRGILYAPDFVINAGGLINVAWDVLHRDRPYDRDVALAAVARIADTAEAIFARSTTENRAPHAIAEAMARDRLRLVAVA